MRSVTSRGAFPKTVETPTISRPGAWVRSQEGETIVGVRGAAMPAGGIRIDPDAFRQPDRGTALDYRQRRRLKLAGPPDRHGDRESRQSKNHQNDEDQDKSTSHAHEVSSDQATGQLGSLFPMTIPSPIVNPAADVSA